MSEDLKAAREESEPVIRGPFYYASREGHERMRAEAHKIVDRLFDLVRFSEEGDQVINPVLIGESRDYTHLPAAPKSLEVITEDHFSLTVRRTRTDVMGQISSQIVTKA